MRLVGLKTAVLMVFLLAFSNILSFDVSSARASVNSTEGTEFFVTFDENYQSGANLLLYLSAGVTSQVTLTWPDGTSETHSVAGGTVKTVNASSKNVVNSGTEAIANRSVKIVASNPIAVYGVNNITATSDAFVAIPTESLGTTYRVISWPVTIADYPARISVVATQPGTTTISVTAGAQLGPNAKGSTYTKTLTQGQVYSVPSSGATSALRDPSGTLISSDKKIVVTSSIGCVNIGVGACDHVTQYLPPVDAWGTSFLLPGSFNAVRPDLYRVIAHEDNTEVTVNGTLVATLSAGQVHSFSGSGANAQTVERLSASKRVLVAHGLQGGSYGAAGTTGDPAFTIVTPTLQFLPSYVVATPASGFATHTLTLIVPTAEVSTVTVNDVRSCASVSTSIPGTDFSVCRLEITAGSYRIASTSGIGVYIAGFNGNDSYAYPGGYAIVDLVANPGGVAALLSAAGLRNLTTSGGDLDYESSESGTTFFIVTAAGDTPPTEAQIKAGIDYSGGTVLASGSATVVADVETTFSVSGLTESSDYKAYLVTEYGDPLTLSSVTTVAFSTRPGVPIVGSVTPGNGQVTVALSPSGSATNFRYSTDGGSTFVNRSPASFASPWTISGLTNGTSYTFEFRSVYGGQDSASTQSFTVTPRPPAVFLSGLATSQGSLAPSFSSSTLAYAVSVPNTTASLTFTPTSAGNTISVAGNTTVSGQESSVIPLSVGVNVVTVSVDSGLTGSIPTSYTITITRAAAAGAGGGLAAPVVPPAVVTPPRALPRVLPTPPPVGGPVVSGTPSAPPSAPTALIGGRPSVVSTQVTDPNNISLRAGVLNIGMNVPSDQGSVRQQGSSTEIQVRNGGVASVSGSGVLPRSTVQVFMPLGGSNSREIARIPVDATGSFSGDALFGSAPTEAPLPIGRHVLQMVTVDENRQQTVVELTVNIAQPPPAPELNRSTNERPTLLPGQSIATNAGQPEAVTVVALPEQKQARVEGDGWLMAVDVPNADGRVSETPEGGAVLELVRDETAVVSGSGFMAGTRADVWLFSDPTLLGTVEIDENGEFNGEVNIDGNVVTAGEHTLQLQGVGEDGFVRAANLGVVVNDAAPVSTEAAASGFLWWLWLLILLLVVAVLWFALWRYRRKTHP